MATKIKCTEMTGLGQSDAAFDGMTREGLSDRMTFERRPEQARE